MKLKELVIESIKGEFPFGISTASAGNSLLISFLLADIGPEAVAAGPFITAFQNLFLGICRASLSSNSLMIGPLNGQAKSLAKKKEDSRKVNSLNEEIGKVIRQGWLYSTILSAGAIGGLLLSERIMRIFQISPVISRNTQDYFNWFVIGIWPLLQSYVDQQLAVGIKNPLIPLIRGPLYAAAVFGFSYLASQRYFGEYFSGIRGVGFGSALAGWLVFTFTKLTHLFKFYWKYSLYRPNFTEGITTFKNLSYLGSKLGFQVACEWFNLVGTSLFIGQLPVTDVRAIQPSVQIFTMTGLFSLGFSAAIGAVLTWNMGEIKSAKPKEKEACNEKFSQRGYFGIFAGMFLPTAIAILAIAYPNILTRYLLADNATDNEFNLANKLLRINGVGIIFDALRLIGAGPLRSFHDINYITFVSFLFMSVIGLAIESGLILKNIINLTTCFWIRNVTILIPALLILFRWFGYSRSSADDKLQLKELHAEKSLTIGSLFMPIRTLEANKSRYKRVTSASNELLEQEQPLIIQFSEDDDFDRNENSDREKPTFN